MDHYHYKNNFEKIFSCLSTTDHDRFFEFLDPKVIFVAPGNHPWSGIFHGAKEVQGVYENINQFLKAPIKYKLAKILVEGNCAFIVMNGEATSNCGKPYNNHYCYYVEMNKDKKISRIEVFYDTLMIQELLAQNTPHNIHKKTA